MLKHFVFGTVRKNAFYITMITFTKMTYVCGSDFGEKSRPRDRCKHHGDNGSVMSHTLDVRLLHQALEPNRRVR